MTSGLIRHLNIFISLVIYIEPDQDSFRLAKDINISDYFVYYNRKKYQQGNKRQNKEKDTKNLVGKSSNNKNIKNIYLKYIPQIGNLINMLSLFLR